MDNNEKGFFHPQPGVAFSILGFLVLAMILAIFVLGEALHITMMIAMGFAILLLRLTGCPYHKLEEAIVYGGKMMISTLLILYCIGALMGAWIASGTVPMIIFWGLKLINPSIFLVTACIACTITAMATGSSWSTIGTVGVALMGVGMGLGMNPAMTAGAIVSGAAFGDKMSPLSDTTNVAPAVAEADLFDHIKAMLYTGGPAILLTLVIFGVLGMNASGTASSDTINQILTSLESSFTLNFVTLIPIALVLGLALMRLPALPTLLISCLTAALISVLMQGQTMRSIWKIMEGGFVSTTGFYEIDKLLSRGGMFSMHYPASLGVIAMVFNGILEKCGVLDVFLEKISAVTRTVGSLVMTTVVAEIILNLVTACQYMTLVLGGRLFVPAYKEKDLLPQCLSRTLEDSGTVTSLLIPWNLCGSFAASTLGVGCFTYLPYAAFNWICPLVAIVWGFTGLFQWKTGEIPSKRTYRPVDSAAPTSKSS